MRVAFNRSAGRGAACAVVGTGGAALAWIVWQLAKPGARTAYKREPAPGGLLRKHAEGFRPVDAWAAEIGPGETADPVEWAHAVISMPPVLKALLRVRDALAGPFGLKTNMEGHMPYTGFPLIDQGPEEVVLGMADSHLDFLVGITTDAGRVTVTTVLRINNPLGRAYWSVVRCFHPWLTRAMLRQAHVPSAQRPGSALLRPQCPPP
ncbi:MAG: DUF2867 domain-containing protein [Bifidobacteriaceae bacterium]|jgi:hypothetical protein|nr:DUF2867 domain-containing protein [Bifidobacteriaceae bacterium]